MLTKLTKKQEKALPKYLNKWVKQGLRTKTIDKKKAKKAINFMYKDILNMKHPKYIVYLDSPMACQLACNLIKASKFDEKVKYSQLHSQLDSQFYSQKLEYFYVSWSNLFNAYYGFYDYILTELFPKKKKDFKKFQAFLKHSQEYHQIYMFENICFVSDFPKEIYRNERNDLHSYNKPALLYRDSYALYRSNGITVTKEFCETGPEEFTKEIILKEENADVRREIIKKIGISRAMEVLGAQVTDTYETKTGGKYELLTIDYDKTGPRPYLKMQCSSSKEVFILGVKPNIKTAKEGLEFLNNGRKIEEINVHWEA